MLLNHDSLSLCSRTTQVDASGSLAVAEQRGASQRPVLRRLDAPQLQREDEVQVGPTWFLIDRTRVQADRPPTAGLSPIVGHVGWADGVDVDHGEGGEEDLRGGAEVHGTFVILLCIVTYYYFILLFHFVFTFNCFINYVLYWLFIAFLHCIINY